MRKRALLSMFVVLLLVGAYTAYAMSQPEFTPLGYSRECNRLPGGALISLTEASGITRDIGIKNALIVLQNQSVFSEKITTLDFSKVIVKTSLLKINSELIKRTVVGIPLNKTTMVLVITDSMTTEARIPLERKNSVVILISEKQTKIIQNNGISKEKITPMVTDWTCTSTVCEYDSQCPSGYVCTSACGDTCLQWDTLCLYYAGLAQGAVCTCCISGDVWCCLACVFASGAVPWACCEEWEKKCGRKEFSPGH